MHSPARVSSKECTSLEPIDGPSMAIIYDNAANRVKPDPSGGIDIDRDCLMGWEDGLYAYNEVGYFCNPNDVELPSEAIPAPVNLGNAQDLKCVEAFGCPSSCASQTFTHVSPSPGPTSSTTSPS